MPDVFLVNGIREAAATPSGPVGNAGSPRDFLVGGNEAGRAFVGRYSGVQLWNYAMADAQALAVYNGACSGRGGTTACPRP